MESPRGCKVFFPGEGHTLKGLIDAELRPTSWEALYSCNVSDSMSDRTGLHVTCGSRDELRAWLDAALAKIAVWRAETAQTSRNVQGRSDSDRASRRTPQSS